MTDSGFDENQIKAALRDYESGKSIRDICSELGIKKQLFLNWNKKYTRVESPEEVRLNELEEKHRRLQQMYLDLSRDYKTLKDQMAKNRKYGKRNI